MTMLCNTNKIFKINLVVASEKETSGLYLCFYRIFLTTAGTDNFSHHKIIINMSLTPQQLAFKERHFSASDAFDIERWGETFAEDMELTFSNYPTIKGRDVAKEMLAKQCSLLKSMRHDTINQWWINGTFFHESWITYVVKGDDREIVLRGILVGDVDLDRSVFKNYRVYLNNTPLLDRIQEIAKENNVI